MFGQIRLELTMKMEKAPLTSMPETGGLMIVTIANTVTARPKGLERHNYVTSVCG
jgi:hypothetical protein